MTATLGERVKAARKHHKLTLEDLALRTGSSRSYIWEIESNEMLQPSAHKLHKIARVLGVSIEHLLGEDIDETANDKAFFAAYRRLPPKIRKQMHQILNVLAEAET